MIMERVVGADKDALRESCDVLRKEKDMPGSSSHGRKVYRIALLMQADQVHARRLFRGVGEYSRPLRAWNFHLGLPHPDVLRQLRRWKPAGILAMVADTTLENRLLALRIPLVNCSSDAEGKGVHRVQLDNVAVGRMAAEHFLSRGFRHLAFCGEPMKLASRNRWTGFSAAAGEAKLDCRQYLHPRAVVLSGRVGWQWTSRDRRLQAWVRGLPKPVGLLASHDGVALLLAEVCREIGVRIPEDVSLLGVDNDEMLCEMSYPTLSSVATPQQRIGFLAAHLLDRLLRGERIQPRTHLLRPVSVVVRQSSDILATDDPVAVAAMRFIREHADASIRVSDVAEAVPLSRRSLETRFRSRFGLSLLEAIQQVHVDQAKAMLRQTRLSLEQIAEITGFNSRERFSRVFRQMTGETPGAYRRQLAAAGNA
ncbi:MAG TPA: hypothetical protein DCX07_13455 [Phycisphaerales bacterium]|nr:hypothetical protein [Phycisphaerales bacterium]